MKTSFLTLLILSLTLISCNKDEGLNSSLFQIWEAKEFMSVESVTYPKNANTRVLLTFEQSGKYYLKLDINSCGGNFQTGKNNQIEIEPTACTEACCDSKFAEKVAAMLFRVTSYEIAGKTLKMNVPQWGYIELELVD